MVTSRGTHFFIEMDKKIDYDGTSVFHKLIVDKLNENLYDFTKYLNYTLDVIITDEFIQKLENSSRICKMGRVS